MQIVYENPHKPGTKRFEQWEERQQKIAEKAKLMRAIEAAKAKCAQLGKKPPEGFADWGAIRTEYWLALAKRCQKLAKQKRPALEACEDVARQINLVPDLTIETICAKLDAMRKPPAELARKS